MTLTRQLSSGQWTAAILLCWLAVNVVWLQLDQRPPTWDDAFHAAVVVDAAQAFGQGAWHTFAKTLVSPVYPPLVYLVCLPAAWVHPSVDVLILWMDLVFGALLASSLWGMARLLDVPWVGVGATLLTLYQPLTVITSRVFMLDFPLMAMVAWVVWRIVARAQQWTQRNGMLLGLAIGLGLLTKWTVGLYVVPVMGWLAFRRIRSRTMAADWRPVGTVALIALAVSGWWYVWRWPDLANHLTQNFWRAQVIEHDPSVWSAANWWFYAEKYQMLGTAVPCLGVLGAVGLGLWRGPRLLRDMVLWLMAGYALLTLSPNKDQRFILPLVPLMAFVTWWGIHQIPIPPLRHAVAAVLGGWCVAQLAVLSSARFGQLLSPLERVFDETRMPLFRHATIHDLPAPPMADGATQTLIARLAVRVSSKPARVLLLVDDMYHNQNTLRYEALQQGMNIQIVSVTDIRTDEELWALWNQSYDFIVYREPTYDHFPYFTRNIQALSRALHLASDRYQRIDDLAIPSGGVLELYAYQPHEVD